MQVYFNVYKVLKSYIIHSFLKIIIQKLTIRYPIMRLLNHVNEIMMKNFFAFSPLLLEIACDPVPSQRIKFLDSKLGPTIALLLEKGVITSF